MGQKQILKNAAGVDTSKFPKTVDLARLKSEIYKLFITTLETAPVDLSKLSEAVKNEVVKTTAYDELVWKVNANQNSNTVNLVKKKPDYNTKITETEKKTFDHNHNHNITTQEFNKLMRETFAARLKTASLGTKSDIADLLKDKYFDNKLENMDKNVTSNKIKHVETEKKLADLTNKVA